MTRLAIVAIALALTACGDPPKVVVETKTIERRPPPTMMVPCPREPAPPDKTANEAAKGEWVAAMIIAGDQCRTKADDLQRFHNTPAAK